MAYAKYAKPYTCILMNVPSKMERGQRVTRSLAAVRDLLQACECRVTYVRPSWNSQGFRGYALVEFGSSHEDCISTFKLERMLENEKHGLTEWVKSEGKGYDPYVWVAREADMHLMHVHRKYVHVPYAIRHEGWIEVDNEFVATEGSMSTLFLTFYS